MFVPSSYPRPKLVLVTKFHFHLYQWLGTISYSVRLFRMIFHVFSRQSHAMPKSAGPSPFLQPMWRSWSGGLKSLTTNYFRIFHEMHPTKCFLSPFAALQGSRFTASFKFGLIAFIFWSVESCGVRYTHANKNIVGPSEAENHMTKQALQDVFELRQFSQQPANCFPALEVICPRIIM